MPAFLAGILVIATHVPLGQRVLARGIVFIDLALAQVAGLGVIVADALGWEAEGGGGWAVQIAAALAALLGAWLLTWTERRWPEVQEALIGVLFVIAASVELLVLANNPHGGEHLKDMLVGQILWVSPSALIPVAILYAAILAVWFIGRERVGTKAFYLLFALAVTQSVQLVGIYLVFATLILPALAVRGLNKKHWLVGGYACGVVGYVLGLVLSAALDLPTGPVIACSLLATFVAMTALWPPKRTSAPAESGDGAKANVAPSGCSPKVR
jgi:zinc/manganese transport system permease protein